VFQRDPSLSVLPTLRVKNGRADAGAPGTCTVQVLVFDVLDVFDQTKSAVP
jgi:hypothetical protein